LENRDTNAKVREKHTDGFLLFLGRINGVRQKLRKHSHFRSAHCQSLFSIARAKKSLAQILAQYLFFKSSIILLVDTTKFLMIFLLNNLFKKSITIKQYFSCNPSRLLVVNRLINSAKFSIPFILF
jgi:hypothetical protein